jgi:hypothetical protein
LNSASLSREENPKERKKEDKKCFPNRPFCFVQFPNGCLLMHILDRFIIYFIIMRLFQALFKKCEFTFDFIFDWSIPGNLKIVNSKDSTFNKSNSSSKNNSNNYLLPEKSPSDKLVDSSVHLNNMFKNFSYPDEENESNNVEEGNDTSNVYNIIDNENENEIKNIDENFDVADNKISQEQVNLWNKRRVEKEGKDPPRKTIIISLSILPGNKLSFSQTQKLGKIIDEMEFLHSKGRMIQNSLLQNKITLKKLIVGMNFDFQKEKIKETEEKVGSIEAEGRRLSGRLRYLNGRLRDCVRRVALHAPGKTLLTSSLFE